MHGFTHPLYLLVLPLIILGIALLIFEIMMIVDALQNPCLNDGEKILWVVGMVLIHPFVGIVYYFMAHSRLHR